MIPKHNGMKTFCGALAQCVTKQMLGVVEEASMAINYVGFKVVLAETGNVN